VQLFFVFSIDLRKGPLRANPMTVPCQKGSLEDSSLGENEYHGSKSFGFARREAASLAAPWGPQRDARVIKTWGCSGGGRTWRRWYVKGQQASSQLLSDKPHKSKSSFGCPNYISVG